MDNQASFELQRPYLIRAIYDWIIDNGWQPYLLVNADYPGLVIPMDYVQQGHIVLNIATGAVSQLVLGNQEIVFQARFSGQSMDILVYPAAVIAIYAKENNQGMFFGSQQPAVTTADAEIKPVKSIEQTEQQQTPSKTLSKTKSKPPSLKIIK